MKHKLGFNRVEEVDRVLHAANICSPKTIKIKTQQRIKYLDFILEKTLGEVELLADKPEELRETNPLYAHIKIAQILGEIIPMLKQLSGVK